MIVRRQPGPTLLQWLIVLAINAALIVLLVFAVYKVRAASRHVSRPGTDAVAVRAPVLVPVTPVVPKEARP